MAGSGSTTVDFGAFPGAGEASVDVSGQPGYVAGSLVEAWLLPVSTADHSTDEHVSSGDFMTVTAQYKVDGTFTVRASHRLVQTLRTAIYGNTSPNYGPGAGAAEAYRFYGQYTIGWVWA